MNWDDIASSITLNKDMIAKLWAQIQEIEDEGAACAQGLGGCDTVREAKAIIRRMLGLPLED